MRTNELGIHYMHQELDVAVIRAQRQAELEQMYLYRAERLKRIQDWSDPEKRKAFQNECHLMELAARRQMDGQTVYLRPLRMLDDVMHVVEVKKPQVKRSWWARIFRR